MMKPLTRIVMLAGAAMLIGRGPAIALDKGADNNLSIKEVMIAAYKEEKLAKKVIRGEASEAEKQRLLSMYEALAETSPPRGSPVSWKRKTVALVEAAQAAVEGEEEAPVLLKKTMECGACHSTHK
ncbi:MAG: hypothetical protein KY475_04930 [Planctomycetes bacterium]|nr:hypothetical protein [Planctomycetota bacterium]